jgi:hypothetical protein
MIDKFTDIYNHILERVNKIPVVDCHEHLCGPEKDLMGAHKEPILALCVPYLISDLWSAGASEEEIALLQSKDASTDEKWPVFSRLWEATEYTAIAKVTKMTLKKVFSIEKLTRQSLDKISKYQARHDNQFQYLKRLHDAGIRAVIADVLMPMSWETPTYTRYFNNYVLKEFLENKLQMPDIWHPVFPLPYFHLIRHCEFIDYVRMVSNSSITSLREYEEAVFNLIKKSIDRGVIALKDQSAYHRTLTFDLPPRSDAERIFNKLLIDPRNQLSWPNAKPLDDYLFHQYMRFARELNLHVQIHTGQMGGIRNRVDKANAAHFASVLELHSEVKFDLFHGNWPYMGDLLFLGKNYPNVYLNLCWVYMIDPIYASELLKRSVMTVPHTKIHGFGGDYILAPEFVVEHLTLGREIISRALADLVLNNWILEEEAIQIAADWLYNNPNAFYKLGLQQMGVDFHGG